MKQGIFEITSPRRLAPGTFEMNLAGDTSAITAPGQFVNIRLDGFFLRRPISVCDWSDGRLTIQYKVVGRGTRAMSELPVGAKLDLLTGLGNGYSLDGCGERPLLDRRRRGRASDGRAGKGAHHRWGKAHGRARLQPRR